MTIDIGKHEFTILWDGIYYFALSDYPNISEWELHKLLQFNEYERINNRTTEIECSNETINEKIAYALSNPNEFSQIPRPNIITECTACKQHGCITEFLCHTASAENAISIISGKELLSAAKARKIPIDRLMNERRNAANDPADFFNYIMFSWGNCQAGDRLIMERKLGHDPNEEDLSIHFTPGVRFYYRYDTLSKRSEAIFDGYHALKIKDRLPFDSDLLAIIIPECYKSEFKDIISEKITPKVHYIDHDCRNIWDWSEKVYNFISKL